MSVCTLSQDLSCRLISALTGSGRLVFHCFIVTYRWQTFRFFVYEHYISVQFGVRTLPMSWILYIRFFMLIKLDDFDDKYLLVCSFVSICRFLFEILSEGRKLHKTTVRMHKDMVPTSLYRELSYCTYAQRHVVHQYSVKFIAPATLNVKSRKKSSTWKDIKTLLLHSHVQTPQTFTLTCVRSALLVIVIPISFRVWADGAWHLLCLWPLADLLVCLSFTFALFHLWYPFPVTSYIRSITQRFCLLQLSLVWPLHHLWYVKVFWTWPTTGRV